MRKKKTYAVFGLGRYGKAVATELVKGGMEVLAVDADQKIVNDMAAILPICKCADVTDPEVIARLGVADIDSVIVCMASNLEASVMAVTLCKEAGVKNVVAKCANEMHQKILLRVGADEVVCAPCKKSALVGIYRYDLALQGYLHCRNRRQARVGRQEPD